MFKNNAWITTIIKGKLERKLTVDTQKLIYEINYEENIKKKPLQRYEST